MERNEPSTEEIVRALRCRADDDSFCKKCQYGYALAHAFLCDHGRMNGNAADRLESLTREIAELTARAEQAERLAQERGQMAFDASAKLALTESDLAEERASRIEAEREREQSDDLYSRR